MQDRMAELRALTHQYSPQVADRMVQGPSNVVDQNFMRGGAFDIVQQMGINGEDAKKQHEQEFMGEFFAQVEEVKVGVSQIQQAMENIRQLRKLSGQATSPEREKEVSNKLSAILVESNRKVMTTKKKLEELKVENTAFSQKHPNSAEARIRDNMHAALTRKFRELIMEYQMVQSSIKKEVKERVTRQVKIVYPEKSDEEINNLVEVGDVAQAIRVRIQGHAHESMANALSDLQDKYRDIRRLEQNVTELYQMFVDLATLVDAQGDLLNQIEYSVKSAKDYTERAENELVVARKYQATAKKRMCWLSVCLIILAIIIMLPLIVVFAR